MAEAQGAVGRDKLPQKCRGRHPHLNAFDAECDARPALIMMGASNLWFASTQSIIVMPRTDAEEKRGARRPAPRRTRRRADPAVRRPARRHPRAGRWPRTSTWPASPTTTSPRPSPTCSHPPDSEEERQEKLAAWDPVDLLVPEWRYLQKPALFPQQQNSSGLMVTEMQRGPELHQRISRVVAVNQMKKVNAVLGFTRLDEMDRVNDLASRLVKLTRNGKPTWVPATEDRGEGIFLQLDLDAVDAWEQTHPRQSRCGRPTARRTDATSSVGSPRPPSRSTPTPDCPRRDTGCCTRCPTSLIREMAMSCGYGAASLTERIYGWPASPQREAAAGLLICTTASDSEGTLGGLVALSEPARLQGLVVSALRRASRCSSDPVCAMRTPSDPEDFLHGAACHCCSFASETSCEKANRFLDRRFLLNLPTATGDTVPGFFGSVDAL